MSAMKEIDVDKMMPAVTGDGLHTAIACVKTTRARVNTSSTSRKKKNESEQCEADRLVDRNCDCTYLPPVAGQIASRRDKKTAAHPTQSPEYWRL